MTYSSIRGLVIAATVVGIHVLASPATAWAGEDERVRPRLPLGEAGLFLPITHRPSHPTIQGGEREASTTFGLGVRGEMSILAALVSALNGDRVRGGDYVGVDLGVTPAGGLTGRIVLGAQVAFEINDTVGVGARAYSLTLVDDQLGPSNLWSNFVVGELSLRLQDFVLRGRYSIAEASNSGYAARDAGFSVRVPMPFKIMDSYGWHLGVDYDNIFTESPVGDFRLHRVTAVFAIAF